MFALMKLICQLLIATSVPLTLHDNLSQCITGLQYFYFKWHTYCS